MFRSKRSIDFICLCLLLAGFGWLALSGAQPVAAQTPPLPGVAPLGCPGQAPGPNPWNPCNWDAHKIMAEIENPHADLVTVAAHRGTHSLAGTNQAPGVPENSHERVPLCTVEGERRPAGVLAVADTDRPAGAAGDLHAIPVRPAI